IQLSYLLYIFLFYFFIVSISSLIYTLSLHDALPIFIIFSFFTFSFRYINICCKFFIIWNNKTKIFRFLKYSYYIFLFSFHNSNYFGFSSSVFFFLFINYNFYCITIQSSFYTFLWNK